MGQPEAVNPNALTVQQLARLLTAASGRQVSESMVQAAIDGGAPAVDGKVNLVNLMAWLEREAKA